MKKIVLSSLGSLAIALALFTGANANAAEVNYEVKSGDTLSQIAFNHFGSADKYVEIANANNIENPHLIFPGQMLKLNTKTESIEVVETPAVETPVVEQEVAPSVEVTESEAVENIPEAYDGNPTPVNELISLDSFLVQGIVNWNGYMFTYYSQSVLPGGGLSIPGRHVNASGYVSDGDGYIVLAGSAPKGTVYDTPFGYQGKIYDRGTSGNHLDVYIR